MKNIIKAATVCMAITLIGFGLPPKQATAAITSVDFSAFDFGVVDVGTTSTLSVRYDFLYSDQEYYISHTLEGGLHNLFDVSTTAFDVTSPISGFVEYLFSFTPSEVGLVADSYQFQLVTGFPPCPEGERCVFPSSNGIKGFILRGEGVSVVPLPPSAILFGTALLGLAGLRRRKRKAA